MKVVCVTAVCGGYDQLYETHPNLDGTKFICFSDDLELQSSFWEIRPAFNEYKDRWDADVRNAKHHKVMIHEHVDCEYSLWMDANVSLYKPVTYLIETYMQDFDIVTFTHWGRQCAYQEADTCIQLGYDNIDTMKNQMAKYEAEGYPKMNGLHAGTFILRRHTREVEEFNRFWWNEICQHSKRDQLSLDFSIWQTGIEVGTFCPYPGNDFMSISVHRSYRK